MARVIRHYQIHSMTDPIVAMPRGSKILKLADKKTIPTIWAIVDPDKPMVKRLIRTFKTDEELIDEPGTYLGTVNVLGYVFHCFDGGERQ